jgi:hypothetical protein
MLKIRALGQISCSFLTPWKDQYRSQPTEKQHPRTGLYRFKDSHKDGKTAKTKIKLIYFNEGPNDDLISVMSGSS